MPSIVDGTSQLVGGEFIDGPLRSHGTHSADILAHSDGSLYCVWAEYLQDAGTSNQHTLSLFFSKSNDSGGTWSSPVVIYKPASGNSWVLHPSLSELSSGDIAVVFNWNNFQTNNVSIVRMAIDTDGAEVTAASLVGSTSNGSGRPILVQLTSSFVIYTTYFAAMAGKTTLTVFTASDFTDTSWTPSNSNNWIGSGNYLTDLYVRKLSDGNLLAVYTYIDSVNGSTSGIGLACYRTNVGYRISTDEGSTWSAHTALTTLNGSPGPIPLLGPKEIKAYQVPGGDIEIVFTHSPHFTVFGSATTPAIATSSALTRLIKRDSLLLAVHTGSGDNPGVYVFDFSSGSVFTITTSQIPTLHNSFTDYAVNSDNTRLVLASSSGLQVIDCSDPNPAHWTLLSTLTTSSLGSLRNNSIARVAFQPSSNALWFTYGATTVSNVFGGIIADIDSPSVTDISASGAGSVAGGSISLVGTYAVVANSSTRAYFFDHDGTYRGHSTAPAGTINGIVFGTDGNWYMGTSSNGFKCAYDGTTITTTVYSSTSTPVALPTTVFGGSPSTFPVQIGAEIAFIPTQAVAGMAVLKPSDSSQSMHGIVTNMDLSFPWNATTTRHAIYDNVEDCLYYTALAGSVGRIPNKRGRIKRARFPYSAGVLSTGGINFFDIFNNVPERDYIRNPMLFASGGDLFIYGIYDKWGGTQKIKGAAYLNITEQELQAKAYIRPVMAMRAKIVEITGQNFESKARILPSLSVKAMIARRQGGLIPAPKPDGYTDTHLDVQFKIAPKVKQTTSMESKARLVKAPTANHLDSKAMISVYKPLTARASILRYDKEAVYDMSYSISKLSEASFIGEFRVRGAVSNRHMRAKAVILGNFESEFVGHFLVAPQVSNAAVVHFDFGATNTGTLQTLRARTLIVQP